MTGYPLKRLLSITFSILCLLSVPAHGVNAMPAAGTGGTTVYLPMVTVKAVPCSPCFYVDSVNGNDSNAGTDPVSPWRSLTKVNNTNFTAGTVVNFKRGSSWTGSLVITDSGVQGKPIIYQAYGTGPSPIIKNTPNIKNSRSRVIDIQASWIVVDGFYLSDALEGGVYLLKGADHNIVSGNEITNVGIGVYVNSAYNLITGNYIHNLNMVVNTPGGSDDFGAIGVGLYNSNNEVADNTMIHCKASSYDFVEDGGAVEWYGIVDNIKVHHNLAYDNVGFLEIGGKSGSAKNASVNYNVSINNGIFSYIHLSGTFSSDVQNLHIENNTIYEDQSGQAKGWVIFGWAGTPTSNTAIVRNNIIYAYNLTYVSAETGFTHDHNLYFFPENITKLKYALTPSEKIADPLFIDQAHQNFRLQAGSPAIDMGVSNGMSLDFIDQPVPSGNAPDAGAYEYHAP